MNHEGRTIEAPHILAETVQVRCDAIVGVLETGHHPLLPPEVNLSMRDARARAACDVAEALGAVVDLPRTHPVEMLHRRAAWVFVRPATSPPPAENEGIAVCPCDLRGAAGEQKRPCAPAARGVGGPPSWLVPLAD